MIVEHFSCFSNLRKFLVYCKINPLICKGCRISPMARSFYRLPSVVKPHFSTESLVVMLCCHGIKQMGKILECPKGTDLQSCMRSKKLKYCWVSLPEKRDSILFPLKPMGGLPLISVGVGACLSFAINLFKLLKPRCLWCQ